MLPERPVEQSVAEHDEPTDLERAHETAWVEWACAEDAVLWESVTDSGLD
jgi:hypothetical protein